MPQPQLCRSGRHVIRGPQDRRANGGCLHCARINESKYRFALRDSRQRLAVIEAALIA
ncbi:hypothetical protein PT015_23255 [Candidatus Mycobacterium wuenschmannii]|uniref:Uncharacterized protein n=1 Tax=Candidatus Mycobacterium wuenschmannii TaxID=3027808 RepID=A0ABY8VZT1_9MYCO|nr:hypothetical protein [Candidatus Mycobacterium wuenschmannii]WIM87712.1 hypothetical protein PT015_23255 [Candidatus Mycobacterium wuenschmannii]